ncbi:MAG: tRNA pseudouridine(55) synthase TruB [Candidatus Pacebacteria bacterium]|nr:tRNA pseudouridine(55) synthase TruB [Candidatus Paceibacterota bacterium]
MEETNNILLIDKPRGISSFDVIRRLRRRLGVKKMGHAGTLDPLASGLMLIGVGEATKKLNDLIGLPKTYVADVLVGERRSTGDREGEVIESKTVEYLKEEDVQNALRSMVGVLRLPVPVYSAVKMGGKRLYKEARAGREVTPPLRDMEVYCAELEKIEVSAGRATLRILFDVASGVYIRSLAEELGRKLGYPATINDLRRTKVGEFNVEDAERLE